MKNISKNDLLSLRIEIPLPAEQRKIAHIVQSWDRAISGTELLIAAKLEQRKGLMQQLLSGERRFPEFTDPWIEVRLGEILFEVNRPVDWDDDKTYQLVSVRRGSKGLFLRGLLKGMAIDTKKLHTIHTGDFLISKRQVVHGATGLTTKEFDGAKVSDSYTILRARDAGLLDIDFFTWLAKTPEMVRKTFLSSNGVHIEKLFFVVKDYLKRRILIPNDIAEQRKIVAVLITADREIALLRDQLAALKEQKKGLMQKLLTGKKRVKVTEEAA